MVAHADPELECLERTVLAERDVQVLELARIRERR
jgi:hypothetical protein